MSVNEREFVKAMYPRSPRWAKRVARMSDGQVFAIYKKEQAKLEKEAKQAKKTKKTNQQDSIPF